MPTRKVTITEPPARVEAKKLTTRIRTRRETVKGNKATDRATNVGQLAVRIRDIEASVMLQGRLLALLTDPTPADLTDDDA